MQRIKNKWKNELLSGERIEMNNYNEKAEKSNKVIKSKKNKNRFYKLWEVYV